jgi:hypothetical protein
MSKKKIKSEAIKEVKHMQSKSEGTKDMKQMQRSKGKGWDGKSRPVTDEYRDSWERIFGRKKFNTLQQEQRDLDESYQQSKRNKAEREDKS